MSNPTAVEEISVERSIEVLQSNIDNLFGEIDNLDAHLSKISTPQVPEASAGESQKGEGVKLIDDLGYATDRIRSARNRIESMKHRAKV